MVIRKALISLAGAGMIFGSTAAVAAPAVASSTRAASQVSDAEAGAGLGLAWIIAALVAAGVIVVVASDDDDEPVSA